MDVSGAKVIVALHAMSAINSFILLSACIRRNLNGKSKNALTITCLLTSNTTFLFHTLAFISGIWVIPVQEKINGRYLKPVFDGWQAYLDPTVCKGLSYLVSLYLPTSLIYMGITLAYIPYWSVTGVLKSTDKVQRHKSTILLKPAALFATLIILPAFHDIVYALTSTSNTKTVLSPFYCQYDLTHVPSAAYLITMQVIAFFAISFFSGNWLPLQ